MRRRPAHPAWHQTNDTRPSSAEDILVFQDKENPTHLFSLGISQKDGRYLELYASKDTNPVRDFP